MRLDREGEDRLIALMLRREFHAVIQIEIAHALFCTGRDICRPSTSYSLRFTIVQTVLVLQRPTAGEDTIHVHRIERLPPLADEERRDAALDRRHAPRGFAVARGHAIPYAPDVFPALPAFAVEKCKLQIVGLVAIPAALNIDLVPRLQPAIADPR